MNIGLIEHECLLATKETSSRQIQKHILWNGRYYELYSIEAEPLCEVLLSGNFMRLCKISDPLLSFIERPLSIKSTRTYFSTSLPLELLGEITKHLDLKSVFSLCLTARYLNNNFFQLFYPHRNQIAEILKTTFISSRFLHSFGRFVKDLGLSLDSFDIKRTPEIRYYPNLKMARFLLNETELDIENMDSMENLVYIEFEQVENVVPKPCVVQSLISKAPRIRYIHFGACSTHTESEVTFALTRLKYLEGIHLDFRDKLPEACFEKTIDEHPDIKYLTCIGINPPLVMLQKFIATCKNLRILNLSSHHPIEKDLVLQILEANPSLELTTINAQIRTQSELKECILLTPHIQNISFEKIVDCTNETVFEIIEQLPELRSLCIQPSRVDSRSEGVAIPFNQLDHLIPKLNHLQILSTEGTSEDSIVKFLHAHRALTSLYIRATEQPLSDKILNVIHEQQIDVMNLFLEGNCFFTKEALLAVIRTCRCLTLLSLHRPSFNDTDLFDLVTSSTQVALLIFSNGFIEDLSLVQRFESLPNYNVIYFRQFAGSSIESILCFAAKCPNLLAIIFEGENEAFADLTRRYEGNAHLYPITQELWNKSYQERIWGLLVTDYLSQAFDNYDD